jgi:hypothetical protein
MTRLFSHATIVMCLGTTAMLAISPRTVKPNTSAEALFAADGAFRDGLYLGQLAAAHGQSQRLAVGRWSTDKDRAMFTAGYRRGYDESLASAGAGAEKVGPTE